MRRRWVLFAAIAASLTSVAAVSQADAYIYVGDGPNISRANNDGTGLDPDFIVADGFLCGVAVDSSFIYWADRNSVGRANLDGTGVTQNFVSLPGMDTCGVAVNASYVFWGDRATDRIGRANLNGTSPNGAFINPGYEPCGVAADAGNVYTAPYGVPGAINRFDPGTGAALPFTGQSQPSGCAIAVKGANVYYGNRYAAALTDIRGINGGVETVISNGAKEPSSIASTGSALYWVNYTNPVSGMGGSVGTVPIDAAGAPTAVANQVLITGFSEAHGIAADSLPIPALPDDDGDGVPNASDACPTVPGPASNQGCPNAPNPKPDDSCAKARKKLKQAKAKLRELREKKASTAKLKTAKKRVKKAKAAVKAAC